MVVLDGMYSYIQNFVFGFDYALSYLHWVVNQPYFIAEGYIFGTFKEVYFKTLIFSHNAYVPHLYIPVISEVAKTLFRGLYGWIENIYPNILFGQCLVVGTIINVFTITLIHWTVKAVKSVF